MFIIISIFHFPCSHWGEEFLSSCHVGKCGLCMEHDFSSVLNAAIRYWSTIFKLVLNSWCEIKWWNSEKHRRPENWLLWWRYSVFIPIQVVIYHTEWVPGIFPVLTLKCHLFVSRLSRSLPPMFYVWQPSTASGTSFCSWAKLLWQVWHVPSLCCGCRWDRGRCPGLLFTKKTSSYWYRDSHYKPETVVRPSKVYNGDYHTHQTASF